MEKGNEESREGEEGRSEKNKKNRKISSCGTAVVREKEKNNKFKEMKREI